MNFVGGGGIFDVRALAPLGMLEEEGTTVRGRGSLEGVAGPDTARTLGVFARADSLKIDLALLGVGMGWMEMGTSNAADDINELLAERDAGNKDNLDALWLAPGDGSNENCDVEAEGGV